MMPTWYLWQQSTSQNLVTPALIPIHSRKHRIAGLFRSLAGKIWKKNRIHLQPIRWKDMDVNFLCHKIGIVLNSCFYALFIVYQTLNICNKKSSMEAVGWDLEDLQCCVIFQDQLISLSLVSCLCRDREQWLFLRLCIGDIDVACLKTPNCYSFALLRWKKAWWCLWQGRHWTPLSRYAVSGMLTTWLVLPPISTCPPLGQGLCISEP